MLIQASLETAPVQPLVQQLSQTQFSHRSMYHPAALRTDGSRSTAAQASAAQLTALLQSQQSTAFLHLAGTADADAEYLQDRRMSYEDGETRTGDPARTKALKQAYCEVRFTVTLHTSSVTYNCWEAKKAAALLVGLLGPPALKQC